MPANEQHLRKKQKNAALLALLLLFVAAVYAITIIKFNP